MSAHTPGPLRCRGFELFDDREYSVAVANTRAAQRENARLLAAAYSSYDKHCGPRAVECAEADLLGEALGRIQSRLAGCFCVRAPCVTCTADLKVLAKARGGK